MSTENSEYQMPIGTPIKEELEEEYGMPVGRLMYHFYVEEGMSCGEIANEIGRGRSTVHDWLQQSGIKMRSRTLNDVQRVMIIAYIDAGLGNGAIAERVGCGYHTVRRYRKDLDASEKPVDLGSWVSPAGKRTIQRAVDNITGE